MVSQASPFHTYNLYLSAASMNGRLAQFARYLSMRQLECFDPGMQWWGYKRSLRSTSTWPNPWTQQCHRTNQTFWKLRGKINRVLPSSTNFQQTQILAWLSIKIDIFVCLANLWFLNCCWKLAGRKKETISCRCLKEREWPALAADDAGCGDKEDRGGEDKEDPKSSKDPNHLFRLTCIIYFLLDFMITFAREGPERDAIWRKPCCGPACPGSPRSRSGAAGSRPSSSTW